MRQTIATVVLPVADVPGLRAAIDAQISPAGELLCQAALFEQAPALHFASAMVFDQAGERPLLVLEVNFDGAPGPFWAQLDAAIGETIRGLLRCCSSPQGRYDEVFTACVAPGSRAPVAPVLQRHATFPAAAHIGARGLGRNRILREQALFLAVREAASDPGLRRLTQPAVHGALRQRLLPDFPWLEDPPEPAITAAEHAQDGRVLVGFAAAAGLALAFPWLLPLLVTSSFWPVALPLFAAAAGMLYLGDLGLLVGALVPAKAGAFWVRRLNRLLAPALALLGLGLASLPAWGAWLAFLPTLAAGIFASATLGLCRLRFHERTDPRPQPGVPSPALVRRMREWENAHEAAADHMGSVVTLLPGPFRFVLVRVAMRALWLAVRYTATDGYLGSMRTIHFAHWAIVDDGRRLLFLSNFDGSWESYLDDFIDKAHVGLTLAWGNSIGFPACRYLSLDGATQGRLFKNWARCSMAESRFWYSAYPELTVSQVVRNHGLATGLAARELSAEAAAAWALTV